jgi:hypothetical protein
MADVTITVSVKGGFDYTLDDTGDGSGGHWAVKHEAGACGPCVGNHNPDVLPFWECNGNIIRVDPDEGVGNLCRCKRVWVKDGEPEPT